VRKTVMEVYGEVAVAKIAPSQKLATHISEQELDSEYRSERSLTVAHGRCGLGSSADATIDLAAP